MALIQKAPEGAKVLDLPSARLARAEARVGEPSSYIKLTAGYVEIKAELDVLVVGDLLNAKIKEALTRLFADPLDVDVVMAEGISDTDLQAIFEFASGKSLGESSASTKP